jgi:hypothetical protein
LKLWRHPKTPRVLYLLIISAALLGSATAALGTIRPDLLEFCDFGGIQSAVFFLWKKKDHSGKLAIAYQKPQAPDPPPSQSPPTTSNRTPGRRRVARDDLEDEAEVIKNELMAMHQPCRLSWCNYRHENKGLHCAVQPNSTHKGIHCHQFALWAGMIARGQHESKITPPVEFTDVGPSSLRGINAHRARDDGPSPTPGPSADRSPSADPTTTRPLGQGPTLESLGINVEVVQFKTGSIEKFIQEHRKDETEELKEFLKRLKSNNITTMSKITVHIADLQCRDMIIGWRTAWDLQLLAGFIQGWKDPYSASTYTEDEFGAMEDPALAFDSSTSTSSLPEWVQHLQRLYPSVKMSGSLTAASLRVMTALLRAMGTVITEDFTSIILEEAERPQQRLPRRQLPQQR